MDQENVISSTHKKDKAKNRQWRNWEYDYVANEIRAEGG